MTVRGKSLRKRWLVSEALSKFIKDEMTKRDMSARQFAAFLDVAPSTVTSHMNAGTKAEPTLTFLRKLAQRTNTPLAIIISLAFPEISEDISSIPPDILLLATRLNSLPEQIRDVIKRLLGDDKHLG